MKITICEILRISRSIEEARAECEKHRNTHDPVLKGMLQNLRKTANGLEEILNKMVEY